MFAKIRFTLSIALAAILVLMVNPVAAQPPGQPGPGGVPPGMDIDWQRGPAVGKLETAEIKIPAGYMFTDRVGAARWLQLTGNAPDPKVIGVLMAESEDNDLAMLFEWDPVGYVKDDEKDSIDANALLTSYQEGTKAGNERRRQQGQPTLENLRWAVSPSYDQQTHNLTWAIQFDSPVGGKVETGVNHNTRLLGRTGVTAVVLICEANNLQKRLPEANGLLKGFEYVQGQKYTEFQQGDRVAEYGLMGLIAAGAGLGLAAKTGLLAKIGLLFAKAGKAIIVGIIAIAAVVGSFFKRRFARN